MAQHSRILIVGDSPMRQHILAQYQRRACQIDTYPQLPDDIPPADEIVLLAAQDDSQTIAQLTHIASQLPATHTPPTVHLQLRSPATLWMLQTTQLPHHITDRLDLHPFTLEDVWARNILVRLPGLDSDHYPPLDRESITPDSRRTVHLVISGFDIQAQAIAINAALVAHYPNYRSTDTAPLRTRITVVERNLAPRRDAFIARYQHLFDNSYYLFVDVAMHTTTLHRPMYHGRRSDFVDIEWEFVEATLCDPIVRRHLARWAADHRQQLSIAVSHGDHQLNLAESTSLPPAVYDHRVTVYVQQADTTMADMLRHQGQYPALYPFGMQDSGYDVTLPLWRLARLVNYFYACSYGERGVPTVLPPDEIEAEWAKVRSLRLRLSSMYNVMTIATKMHSMGHNPDEAATFYALTQSEIETLSLTEHNRWSVERLIAGNRPCTDDERQEISNDITRKRWYKDTRGAHYDLCAYEELVADETGKNVQLYDYDLTAAIPLIAKTFADMCDTNDK